MELTYVYEKIVLYSLDKPPALMHFSSGWLCWASLTSINLHIHQHIYYVLVHVRNKYVAGRRGF